MNKASARLSRGTLGFLTALIAFAGALISSPAPMAQTTLPFEQQVTLPGSPFAVQITSDGHWAFTSLSGRRMGIAILEHINRGYQLVHIVPTAGPALGLTLSRDGSLLLAATLPHSVAFIDVGRAITGASDAVLGYQSLGAVAGTIELALSGDGRFLFAANENSSSVSVINVRHALRSDFAASAVIGQIPVELAPVGLAVSPDDAHLFVTNEEAKAGTPGYNPNACTLPGGTVGPQGTITVVDVRRAEISPATSVVSRAYAGCVPVRIALSRTGDIGWVSARASNQLEAFSIERLLVDPAQALISTTPVGPAPVGLQLFAEGRLIAVANSNRFATAPGSVSIVRTQRALNHQPATQKTFNVGLFPRQWALSGDGTLLLLTEFSSSRLDIFEAPALRQDGPEGG
jgi:DNA-binding beta-propeller fold protein YncE